MSSRKSHSKNYLVVPEQTLSAGVLLAGLLLNSMLPAAAQPPEASTTQPTAASTPQPITAPNAANATITGSGTAGRIPVFTGASTIGNSILFQSAGKIGVGTTTPGALFQARGSAPTLIILGQHLGSGVAVRGNSVSGVGVFGTHSAQSGTSPGVQGETASKDANASGVKGIVTSTNAGENSAGMRGINKGTGAKGIGVYGSQDGSGYGVYGFAPGGIGVIGGDEVG